MKHALLIAAGALIACSSEPGIAPFPELDVDSNGRISEQEATEDPALVHRFTQVDADSDGQLSALEYLQAAAR